MKTKYLFVSNVFTIVSCGHYSIFILFLSEALYDGIVSPRQIILIIKHLKPMNLDQTSTYVLNLVGASTVLSNNTDMSLLELFRFVVFL